VEAGVRAPRLRKPCSRDWDELVGDAVTRHCAHCRKTVTDLSAMRPEEARRFVAEHPDACLRFRADTRGRIVFEQRRVVSLAVLATVAACASWHEPDAPTLPSEPPALVEDGPRIPAAEEPASNQLERPRVEPEREADEEEDREDEITRDASREALARAEDPAQPAFDSERAPLARRIPQPPELSRRELRELRYRFRPRPRRTRVWTGR
jgi:hypothetical protein